MTRPNVPPLVVTVHGLNTDGTWQDDVKKVLEPHCKCEAYRYHDYRYFGFALQFFGHRCALFAVLFLGLGVGLKAGDVDFSKSVLESWLQSTEPSRVGDGHTTNVSFFGVTRTWTLGVLSPILACAFAFLAGKELTQSAPDRGKLLRIWFTCWVFLLAACVLIAVCPGVWVHLGVEYWLVPTLGVAFILFSLLDRFLFSMSRVSLLKTWLFPLGCLLLVFWAGITSGRLSHHIMIKAGVESPPEAAVYALFGAGLLALLAPGEAVFNRRRRVEALRKFLEERAVAYREECKAIDDSASPEMHVIAHSLGSYLLGQVLKGGCLTPGGRERISRIILVGSVLPTDFPWEQALYPSGQSGAITQPIFDHVRNEAGGRDWIVKVAGYTQNWSPLPLRIIGYPGRPLKWMGFGDSGRFGFRQIPGTREIVHNVANSLDFCEQCCNREELSERRIHNVMLPTFLHSDGVEVIERAYRFWLPILLGYEPWEYWDFHRLCRRGVTYERKSETLKTEKRTLDAEVLGLVESKQKVAFSAAETDRFNERSAKQRRLSTDIEYYNQEISGVERQLAQRVWYWTERHQVGQSLVTYLAERIKEELVTANKAQPGADLDKRAGSAAYLSVKRVWQLVDVGRETLAAVSQGNATNSKVRLLDPRFAIEEAARIEVLETK